MTTFTGPSLDPATGRLREKHVPEYLTQAAQNATFAMVTSVPAGLANTPDATAGIQSVLNSAATFGAGVYIPPGTYNVTATLENFHLVDMPAGVVIKANAPGMGPVARSRESTRYDGIRIYGPGIIDANTNATMPLHLRYFLNAEVTAQLRGGNVGAIKLGSSTAGGRSAEAHLHNTYIRNEGNVVAGSRAIIVENSGDHVYASIEIQNYEGIASTQAGCNGNWTAVHGWAEPSKGIMKVGWEERSNNSHFMLCHADTPAEYGWRVWGYQCTWTGCGTYNNGAASTSTDNTAIGIKFESPNAIATINNHFFLGSTTSKRLKADVETADGNYGLIQWKGCQPDPTLVVTTRTLTDRGVGLVVRDFVTAGKGFILDAIAALASLGISIRTGGLKRWYFGSDGGSESGANAGSGFTFQSFDDAGNLIKELVSVARGSGTWVWNTTQLIKDGCNVALSSVTGTMWGTNASQKQAWWGAAPTTQRTVSGPRGSAAALASLTAALATPGLVADATVSPISTKTTSQTITAADCYVISNGGTLTQTLPDPTLASVGYPVTIKNINASNCTVASLGGGLIDGAATKVLAQWDSVKVVTNGTQWLIV